MTGSSAAFAGHNASLETFRPPIFSVVATERPRTRSYCAATDRAWYASRADPIRPITLHDGAAPLPTPAANRRASGVAQLPRSHGSARARNESELFELNRPSASFEFASIVAQRVQRVYLRRLARGQP